MDKTTWGSHTLHSMRCSASGSQFSSLGLCCHGRPRYPSETCQSSTAPLKPVLARAFEGRAFAAGTALLLGGQPTNRRVPGGSCGSPCIPPVTSCCCKLSSSKGQPGNDINTTQACSAWSSYMVLVGAGAVCLRGLPGKEVACALCRGQHSGSTLLSIIPAGPP